VNKLILRAGGKVLFLNHEIVVDSDCCRHGFLRIYEEVQGFGNSQTHF
jgi:hypothetical protein